MHSFTQSEPFFCESFVHFYVFREIILYDVPKEKKNFLDGEVAIHVSGFGIYPDIYELEQAAAGVKTVAIALIKIFTILCQRSSSHPRF